MPFETTCPKGHRLQVSDAHLGQRIQCPACSEWFVVPDGSRAVSPPPPSRPQRWNISLGLGSDFGRFSLLAGRPMVAVGLVLVLLSKGCDAIGRRSVERADAMAQKAVEQFNDDVKAKELALQRESDEITSRGEAKPDDQKKLDDLHKRRTDLTASVAKDRTAKQNGEWRDLEIAAEIGRHRPENQRLLARVVLRLCGHGAIVGAVDCKLGRGRGRTLGHPDDAGDYHLQPVRRRPCLDPHAAVSGCLGAMDQ